MLTEVDKSMDVNVTPLKLKKMTVEKPRCCHVAMVFAVLDSV